MLSDYILVRDYDGLFRHLDSDFNKLLGIETVYCTGSKNESALVQRLTEFAWRAQKFDQRPDRKQVRRLNMDFLRLRGLYNNIKTVLTERSDLRNKIIEKLLDGDDGNFYGMRLEIHIAACLADRGVQFAMPDPPDFRIEWNGTEVQMECISLHFTRAKHDLADLRRKVEDAIIGKTAKRYCGLKSALTVDITNLQAHGTDTGHLLDTPTSLTNFVAEVQHGLSSRFGAVVATSWNYRPRTQKLISGYVRHDEPDADPALVSLLDHAFPHGKKGEVVIDAVVPLLT